MSDLDKALMDELPKIVQISFIEIMLAELLEQQQLALQELNDFKQYSYKKISILEDRLFKINKAAKNTSNGLEKLIGN